MKKLFVKSILSVVLVFGVTGCNKLEDLYQDPDGFSKKQADQAGVSIFAGYFTSQLTQGFFLRGDYGSEYHQLRSGNRIMGAGVQLYYLMPEGGTQYTLYNVENDWGSGGFNHTVFNYLNSDWIKQYLWAQKEYNKTPEAQLTESDKLYMKLLQFLKGVAYQRAIDMYDEVPYFETGTAGALDGEKAQYLGQKDIYPIILEEAKETETYLANLTLTSADQSLFTRQDVIFNGDIMQWRKYINALRYRWAINISEPNPTLTATVLSELSNKPIFDSWNDIAGLADIAIVEPYRIQVELGITRAFRERSDECRASNRFLQEVMNCVPVEKSKVVNGQTLYYYDGDNSATGLVDGTVDPRVAYIFSKDVMGRYVGAETKWDNGSNPNSHMNKILRGYYINDPIMTDINVTEITFGAQGFEQKIKLNTAAAADLTKREAFLIDAFRNYIANYSDNNWTIGTNRNLISEYNVRPQYNFDLRFPTIQAVEVELLKAEAAVRGLGTVTGTATEHYKKAIELSCAYWYDLNANNKYSKQTTPSFPSNMDQARIDRDRPKAEYNAAAYAEFAGQKFDALSDKEKVRAIFNQLQLNYNIINFEPSFTAARRMIKFIGDNPAAPLENFKWKERMFYNPGIQATDPEAWAKISQHDNADLPLWFTGRQTKWKNVLE